MMSMSKLIVVFEVFEYHHWIFHEKYHQFDILHPLLINYTPFQLHFGNIFQIDFGNFSTDPQCLKAPQKTAKTQNKKKKIIEKLKH